MAITRIESKRLYDWCGGVRIGYDYPWNQHKRAPLCSSCALCRRYSAVRRHGIVLYFRVSRQGPWRSQAVFWDVTPRGSCMNRRFGVTYRLHHQGENSALGTLAVTSNWKMLRVTTNVVPRSLILFNLMMETICSSETQESKRRIPEDGILHSHGII
jgi:hypothetical protein